MLVLELKLSIRSCRICPGIFSRKSKNTASGNGRVLFLLVCSSKGVRLLRTLTDSGTEYCGIRENHPYQLYLYLNDIEHTKINETSSDQWIHRET